MKNRFFRWSAVITPLITIILITILSLSRPIPVQAFNCIIQNPPQAEYGKEYTIEATGIGSDDNIEVDTSELKIRGTDVVLPGGEMVLDAGEKHTFTTQLGIGNFSLSISDRDNEIQCQSSIQILPSTDPNISQPTPLPSRNSNGLGYRISEPSDESSIDGKTESVTIEFDNIVPGLSYLVCYESDVETCELPGVKKEILAEEIKNNAIVLKNICGDGNDAVKRDPGGKACNKDRDYFHEGYVYQVHLYEKETSSPIITAEFYVRRTYPTITISEGLKISPKRDGRKTTLLFNDLDLMDFKKRESEKDNDFTDFKITNPLQFKMELPRKNGGDKTNNFQLVLEGQGNGYKNETCEKLSGDGTLDVEFNNDNINSSSDSSNGQILPVGKYLLKINEQINDESSWKHTDDCQGGFTYYHIPIYSQLETDDITGSQRVNLYVDIANIEIDPNESEHTYVPDELRNNPLPCARGTIAGKNGELEEVDIDINNIDKLVECTRYETAFGTFGIKPIEFIKSFAQWLLGIGMIAAFVVTIYSGYILMTSRGDKEKITQAREILTSAITGLIFLILSIAILEIIGVDILQIPGFSREESSVQASPSPTLPPARPADRGSQ